MTRQRALSVLGLGLALSASAALCAEDPDPDFSLEETVKAGPFHVAPFLVVKDFGYDDNVRLNSKSPISDYTLTVGPGARAVLPLGRISTLALWDEIDYAMFARETDLNHVNNTLRAKLHTYVRDSIVFIDGQHESYRERPNTEIDTRLRTTVAQGRFGISYRPEPKTRLDAFLQRSGYDYDAGKLEVTDEAGPNAEDVFKDTGEITADTLRRTETMLGFNGRLRVRPRTSALLDLLSGRIDFDRTEPLRDSTSVSALTGLEFDPAGPIRGSLKVGYKHLSPDDDQVSGFSGLVADTAVDFRIAGRGSLKAIYQRDTGFSILGDNLFYVQDHAGLSYEHFVNTRLSVELGRQYYEVDYPLAVTDLDTCEPDGLGGQTCSEGHRLDEVVSDTVAVRYRLGPSLKIGLAYNRWDRDSTFDLEDTQRNTATALVEYTP